MISPKRKNNHENAMRILSVIAAGVIAIGALAFPGRLRADVIPSIDDVNKLKTMIENLGDDVTLNGDSCRIHDTTNGYNIYIDALLSAKATGWCKSRSIPCWTIMI
jgi:hypothetical protein